jgi:hypothetical protein
MEPHIASSLAKVETQGDGLELQNSRRRVAPNSRHLFPVTPRAARTRKLLRTCWHKGR